jgi:transposase InsO family protein
MSRDLISRGRLSPGRIPATGRTAPQEPRGCPDDVSRSGVRFVGDITCVCIWQRSVYAATEIDWYSTKVVGCSIADHMRTEVVADALRNAAALSLFRSPVVREVRRR